MYFGVVSLFIPFSKFSVWFLFVQNLVLKFKITLKREKEHLFLSCEYPAKPNIQNSGLLYLPVRLSSGVFSLPYIYEENITFETTSILLVLTTEPRSPRRVILLYVGTFHFSNYVP